MDHRVQVPPAGPQVAAGLARGGMSPRGVRWWHAPQGGGTWPETNRSRAVSTHGVTCAHAGNWGRAAATPLCQNAKDSTREKRPHRAVDPAPRPFLTPPRKSSDPRAPTWLRLRALRCSRTRTCLLRCSRSFLFLARYYLLAKSPVFGETRQRDRSCVWHSRLWRSSERNFCQTRTSASAHLELPQPTVRAWWQLYIQL